MQSISGLIPYLVIQKVYHRTKHHTNSRLRKNASSRGKRRKLQSAKSCSILLHIPACLRSSIQANHIKLGLDSLCTMHRLLQPVVRAITTRNPEDQEALTGTRRVGTKAQAIITRTAEAKAAATGAVRILSRGEGLLRSLQQVAVVQLAAAMELAAGRIFHKALRRMARLVQAEVRTILKVVLAIRVMGAGNSAEVKRPWSWTIYL